MAVIPDRYQEVTIRKKIVDLNKDDLILPAFDGVLTANLLHFIKQQDAFVEKLRALSNRLLIVEYDDKPPSRWVPYPLGFAALRSLLQERGFTRIARIGMRPSRFGGLLYSVFAES